MPLSKNLTPEEKRAIYRAKAAAYRAKNGDKLRAHRKIYQRQWYLNGGWKIKKEHSRKNAHKYKQRNAENQKRMWAEDPERARAYGRKHKLKINEREAGREKPSQCEVCGDGSVAIHFDHCHQTGAFRGWICFHCNTILGHAKDDPDHLRKLITYLTRSANRVGEPF